MSPRLWLVVILALAGAFAPSRVDARGAETCAQGFLATATTARPQPESQVAGTHQGFAAWGYELASGYSQAAETAGADAYSVAFKMRLAPESYPGLSRAAHFQEANEALLQAMESDEQFAQSMKDLGVELERTPSGLAPRTSPDGWTWHHGDGLGDMELVPRYQHTPGSDFWDILHPGGRGGYSIWGQ